MDLGSPPVKFIVPFADGDVNKVEIPVTTADPTRASQTLGFPPLTMQPISAGGVPPQGEDFNGAMNQIARATRWAMAGGLYPYDPTFAQAAQVNGYPHGALLLSNTGRSHLVSRDNNNTSNPDTSVSGNWGPLVNPGLELASPGTTVALTDVAASSSYVRITGAVAAACTLTLPPLNDPSALFAFVLAHDGTGASVTVANASATSSLTVYPGQMVAMQMRNDGTLFDALNGAGAGLPETNIIPNSSAEYGVFNWSLPAQFSTFTDALNGTGTYVAINTGGTFTTSCETPKGALAPAVNVAASAFISTAGVTGGTVRLRIACYNSVGGFLAYADSGAGLLIPNGQGYARYVVSGTTVANTASVAISLGLAGTVISSSGGLRIRRTKLQAGAAVTPYSQEASIAALASLFGTVGLAGNGFQTLPNGLMLQWGTGSFTGPSGDSQPFNFTTAFPNAVFVVLGTIGSALSSGNMGFGKEGSSLTQYRAGYVSFSGVAASSVGFSWLAIGR